MINKVIRSNEVRSANLPMNNAEVSSLGLIGRIPLWFQVGSSIAAVAVALVLWWLSLGDVNLSAITDYGLVSVLPAAFFAALALLNISFCLTVGSDRLPEIVVMLHVVALVVIIHSTVPLLYDAPRYSWTYKHIGVVEYIQTYGSVNEFIDVYHNWPGLFALSALFNQAAGIESSLQYAIWAQLFFNLLSLGGLLLVLRAVTTDRRLVWFAIWIFYLTNWVAQDYFAPQALAFYFFLIVLGLVLRFTRAPAPSRKQLERWLRYDAVVNIVHWGFRQITRHDVEEDALDSRQIVLVKVIIVLALIAIVATHQLTPLIVFTVIAGLVVLQRSSARMLPVLLGVMFVSWMIYMALAFLGVRTEWYSDVGTVTENASNLVDLTESTAGRSFVATSTRVLTAGLWGLAVLGGLRRLFKGYWDISMAVVPVGVFAVMFVQSYGGEILFRVFLFSLPAMAFFAAALLLPTPRSGRGVLGVLTRLVVTFAMLGIFIFAFYGDERMNRFTDEEVEAAAYIYEHAPPGTLLLSLTYNVPTLFERNYYQFQYGTLTDTFNVVTDSSLFRNRMMGEENLWPIEDIMRRPVYSDVYLLLSRSQAEHGELHSIFPADAMAGLQEALLNSDRFQVVFSNDDAQVFKLAPGIPKYGEES